MPKFLRMFIAAGLALALTSGCTTQETQSSESQESYGSSGNVQTDTGNQQLSQLTEEGVREIIQASYEAFEEIGLTETVVSQGETWMLLHDPSQPYYQAGLFNRTTGLNELIFETDYFTHFLPYLMMQTPGFEITVKEESFIVVADGFSPLEYRVSDGLLSSATGIGFDWEASFEYRVDEELQRELVMMADELVESFD